MAARDEEWTCPRCGLVGDHHKTPDPERCKHCCAADACLETLATLRSVVTHDDALTDAHKISPSLMLLVRTVIATAEGRDS